MTAIELFVVLRDPAPSGESIEVARDRLCREVATLPQVRASSRPERRLPRDLVAADFRSNGFMATATPDALQGVLETLARQLSGQKTLAVKAKGSGKELHLKLTGPEDAATLSPYVRDFINC